MKYFTKAWRSGDLSDTESDRVRKDYWDYIKQNKGSFPTNVRLLATEVNLHDGLFTGVCVNKSTNTLKMSILIGDLQVGYEDLTLSYSGVDLTKLDVDLLKWLANSEETEFLYDEVENLGDDIFEHRISFWPDGEVNIRFKAVAISRSHRKDRKRNLSNTFFQVST